MKNSSLYYFDNNATTKIAPAVVEAMLPYLTTSWGNPSSPYQLGRQLNKPLESARESVAQLLGAASENILFTSGGTESINSAINSALLANPKKRHLVTTAVEHSATIKFCQALEKRGYQVTYESVSSGGALDLENLERLIRPDTAIVSVLWANNETGVLFPVEQIAAICRERNTLLHVDAVQVAGKLPMDLQDLDVDFLSISAHKLHGPKGIGALYVKNRSHFWPSIIGGQQEQGQRGGTENVPSIIALGKAAELARNVSTAQRLNVVALRDRLESGILKSIPGVTLHGRNEPRLPNTSSLTFAGTESEAVLLILDQYGICASGGSACTTGSAAPSPVLLAMGLRPDEARATLRFSLGYENSTDDVDYLLKVLPVVIEQIRRAASPRLLAAFPNL